MCQTITQFHYQNRIQELCLRISHPELQGELEQRVEKAHVRYANTYESCAVCIYKFDKIIGNSFQGSNGDLMFVIFRLSRVVTVLIRRSSQSLTRDAFSVDRVLWMLQ